VERRFADRADAGRALARALGTYRRAPDAVVLGLPRGGVPVAFEIAQALDLPLDVLVVRKLGLPWQPELAMGAIASGGALVVNEDVLRHLGGRGEALESVRAREQAELERREREYRGDRPPLDLRGRTGILVDDGLATGATMEAAVRALKLGAFDFISKPLDLAALGADVYAGNCHKWLGAPKGSGFLWARPEHHDWIAPPVVSWGYRAGAGFGERHGWQGTRDPAAYLAVPKAIEVHAAFDLGARRLGRPSMRRVGGIEQHQHFLVRERCRMVAGLARRPGELRLPGDRHGARRRGSRIGQRGDAGAHGRFRAWRQRRTRAQGRASERNTGPHRQGFPNGMTLTTLSPNASRSSPP